MFFVPAGGGFTFQRGPPAYDELFYTIGITSQKDNEGLSAELRMAQAYLRGTAYQEALVVMSGIIRQKVKRMGYATLFDMRNSNDFDSTLPNFISQQPSFRDAIHVGERKFRTEPAFISHRSMIRVENDSLNVILANYKLLLFTGQFDMFTPYITTAKWISEISWPGCSMFHTSPRKNWIIDGQLLGYWKHAKNLTHLLIRNAGHMVGRSQPLAMTRMLDYFIEGKFN